MTNPMFDLSLFRVPTFDGGLIAAFCMNGSLFSMLLYLVLYLQYALGYSALQTGLRLLLISGPTLVTATVAGRLSERVPVRWLIGPGLLLVGAGLFLMTGLTGTSSWTHLIPGFIVSGAGAGFVNPPLASTAIGVVEPSRAGMASGRQHHVPADRHRREHRRPGHHLQRVVATRPRPPSGAGATTEGPRPQIVNAVRQGQTGSTFGTIPRALRGQLEDAIKSSFASGINNLLYVTGALALVGAVCSLLLIRNRDFASRQPVEAASQGAPEPVPGPA